CTANHSVRRRMRPHRFWWVNNDVMNYERVRVLPPTPLHAFGIINEAKYRWVLGHDPLSFPKIPSELNWHDEVESLHRQWRCLRSFMHSGRSSPTCSSRVVGLKPRTSFSVIS